jgi:hypothetical protein
MKYLRGQKMKKTEYLEKDERELAESLENEEWVSDLTKKEKKRYQEYTRHSLSTQKQVKDFKDRS